MVYMYTAMNILSAIPNSMYAYICMVLIVLCEMQTWNSTDAFICTGVVSDVRASCVRLYCGYRVPVKLRFLRGSLLLPSRLLCPF